jgi:hypothetical protein
LLPRDPTGLTKADHKPSVGGVELAGELSDDGFGIRHFDRSFLGKVDGVGSVPHIAFGVVVAVVAD